MSTEAETEAVEQVVIDAMIEHGPDGHIDGYDKITRAAIAAVEPLIRERLAQEVEAARVASGNDAAPWYAAARIVRGDAS